MYFHSILVTHLNIEKVTGSALYGLIAGVVLPPCLMMTEVLLYGIIGLEKQAAPASLNVAATHPYYFLSLALILSPLLETFVFQVVVFSGAKLALRNTSIALIITSVLFSIAHLSADSSRQSIIALFSGMYFTYIYAQIASISRISGFVATVVCHATHNAIVCTIGYYLMWRHPNGILL